MHWILSKLFGAHIYTFLISVKHKEHKSKDMYMLTFCDFSTYKNKTGIQLKINFNNKYD